MEKLAMGGWKYQHIDYIIDLIDAEHAAFTYNLGTKLPITFLTYLFYEKAIWASQSKWTQNPYFTKNNASTTVVPG